MQDATERERGGGAGVVAFVFALALAFLASLTLSVVGADSRVAASMAPLAALAASAALGVAQVVWTSSAFLGRLRRSPGASGAGVAFSAAAVALAIAEESRGDFAVWMASACGLSAAFAPWFWRGVAGMDGLSERFPHFAARAPIAVASAALGMIGALAGVGVVSDALAASVTQAPAAQRFLIGTALLLSAAPGGGRGVIGGDVASAAFLVATATAVAAFALVAGHGLVVPSFRPIVWGEALPWQAIGLALAVATSPLVSPQVAAERGVAETARFSWTAAFCAAAGLTTLAMTPLRSALPMGGAAAQSGVEVLLGLSLARAGVVAVGRAIAYDLPWSRRARIHLANLRLSWMRLVTIIAIGIALALSQRFAQATEEPFLTALAFAAAAFPPLLALAFLRIAGSAAALAALAASACAFFLLSPRPFPLGAALLEVGMKSAAIAFASGCAVALALPARLRASPED